MASDSLSSLPLNRLKGVGPAAAEKLTKLGLHNLEDLLFHQLLVLCQVLPTKLYKTSSG